LTAKLTVDLELRLLSFVGLAIPAATIRARVSSDILGDKAALLSVGKDR
jgi:hypothetical protein